MLARIFVAGETSFFPAGTQVNCVPAWLLVIHTLGAPDLGRVLLQGFLLDSFPFSMAPLFGAVAWLGAGGDVGESDGIVDRAFIQ